MEDSRNEVEEVIQSSLVEMADSVIYNINRRTEPFARITLVFHSTKIAQWFKAYFLKRDKTNSGVLMNVEFETLSSFINNIINCDGKNHILTASEYREYLIKALLTNESDVEEFNYFKNEGNINGINLFEFADKLSDIIFNMEFDDEPIGETPESAWQKDIYDSANKFAEENNCFTPKMMYEKNKNKNNLKSHGGNVYVFNNSYITDFYYGILKKSGGNVTVFSLDNNNYSTNNVKNIKLYSAPSKKREVENLHSDICKKIKEGAKEGAFVNDFVVYAPDINDYANIIRSVFQRSKPGFPEVPFRIIGESREKQNMISALDLLYKIANKHFFTRYDLQKYLKNTMVMSKWDIDNDDITAFMQAVEETNAHRNGAENDDWEYLKDRLLVSMLSDGKVDFNNGSETAPVLPYSTIAMDVDRINKLIDIIDVLSSWSKSFDGDLSSKMLSKEEIEKIIGKPDTEEKTDGKDYIIRSGILNALFSIENKYGEEKNYLYADVRNEAEKILKLFEDTSIPTITFLLLLKDSLGRYSTSPADVFAGGVTFLSLDVDNIVHEKYTYILGLSSNKFPRIEEKNEIDYSTKHRPTKDLDEMAYNNLLRGEGDVIISFTNRDLQTDEEFFRSNVINCDVNEEKISLDEERKVDELFTYRELLNKKRIVNIGKENKKPTAKTETAGADMPKTTTGKIKKYLENTIVYKYSQLLKDSEDEDSAKTDEYENIDLDGLKKYAIAKEIIRKAVTPKDGKYLQWNDIRSDVLNKLKLEKKLPNTLEEEYLDTIHNEVESVIEQISGMYGAEKSFNKMEPFTLPMNGDWILEVNTLCYVKEDNTELSFIEPRDPKDGAKYYLPLYVCALAFVANKDGNEKYKINLIAGKTKVINELTSEKAKETLNLIFKAMQDLEHIKYMDIEFVDAVANPTQDKKKKDNAISTEGKKEDISALPDTIFELAEEINNHNSWKYFKDKKMLDASADFGYSDTSDFSNEIREEYEKMVKLLLYYSREKEETENE